MAKKTAKKVASRSKPPARKKPATKAKPPVKKARPPVKRAAPLKKAAAAKKAKARKPAVARPKPKAKAAAKPKSGAGPKRAVKARPAAQTPAPPRPAAKAKPAKPPPAAKPAKPAPVARPVKRVEFDKKALESIREQLTSERADLVAQLEELESAAFGSASEAAAEGGFDEDYADAGTATFEREKDLSIVNNIQDLMDKIDKALSKIDDGSYGLCESCGLPISADRLKALPHVLLCIKCKKAEERR